MTEHTQNTTPANKRDISGDEPQRAKNEHAEKETARIVQNALQMEQERERQQYPMQKKIKSIVTLTILLSFALGIAGGILGTFILAAPEIKNALLTAYPRQLEPITIADEESAIIDVADQAKPAVVSIIAKKQVQETRLFSNQEPRFVEQEVSGGTGFLVRENGTIVTNKHVVSDETATYEVLTNDGTSYEATVLARDPVNDIAIVKIEGGTSFPTLPLGDSANLKVGQRAVAIGNALGQFPNSVSVGVVSGIGRSITAQDIRQGQQEQLSNIIQTDAAINQGNSGGPLLDIRGNVIGVNTAIAANGQNVNFALAINDVRKDLEQVETIGRIQVPYMGVRYVMLNEQLARVHNVGETTGALIANGTTPNAVAVLPGSPADKAGLKAGDIIMKFDGIELHENSSLSQALKSRNVGEEIELEVKRADQTLTIRLTLEERPTE